MKFWHLVNRDYTLKRVLAGHDRPEGTNTIFYLYEGPRVGRFIELQYK